MAKRDGEGTGWRSLAFFVRLFGILLLAVELPSRRPLVILKANDLAAIAVASAPLLVCKGLHTCRTKSIYTR